MKTIKNCLKLLGIIVLVFLTYFFFTPQPNQLDYFLMLELNQKSEEIPDDNGNTILQDSYIVQGRKANFDIYINKQIDKVTLKLSAIGLILSDYFTPDLDDIEVKIGDIKVKGDEFNLNITQELGDEQIFPLEFSWHGGLFWRGAQFKAEQVVNVHWLNSVAFNEIFIEETNKKFKLDPGTMIEINGFGADDIAELPENMTIKNNSNFDVKDLKVRCTYWDWQSEESTSFVIPLTISKHSTASYPYPDAIREANFPKQFSVSCRVKEVVILEE